MRLRDFVMLVLICLIWGYSNVLSKIVVSIWHVPPLFFAGARFALVLLVTAPWLLPMPRPRWRIAAIGLLMGAGTFGLLFVGLRTSSPSAAAVVIQAGVPFTVLLSVMVLQERVGRRRLLGILLTLAGVLLVLWTPSILNGSQGLWFVLLAALSGSLGAIMMKQIEGVSPLRVQAWVAATSLVPLAFASLSMEQGQWNSVLSVGWSFMGALAFAALVVSVAAHTLYFGLIQRYDANLLAPLTLMTPLATIGFGVLLTGDRFEMNMIVGTGLALLGVLFTVLGPESSKVVLIDREQA